MIPASDPAQLVLLHGVGLDRTVWEPLRALLGRPSLALDLPGHGHQAPLREEHTLRTLAEALLPRLPEGRWHLVGFSLGALVAQHLAWTHPDRVASLVAVGSVCRRTPVERAAVLARLDLARRDPDGAIAASLRRWFPEGTTVPPATIEATRTVLEHNDPESFLHAYRVFATGDAEIAPHLPEVHAPTLAITGADDPGSTPEMSRRLAAAVADGRAQIVAGARHMLPVEQPGVLATAVAAFIDSASKGVSHG